MNIIVKGIDAIESDWEWRKYQNTEEKIYLITIRTEYAKSSHITGGIADNGNGMTEQVKNKLFDAFFTTKPVGKGTGLGLSISYQIVVDKHQGLLWCESAPGQGTEFFIQIPVRHPI
ncbi:histidine kinase [Microseira wollei NIES-4236]|uniref:histidine kinase n=2 Tax=Microseira wollei TaxID=467598 RepID=A0AAV3XJT6_9CYAN|nr:histidine kinase [Microseira wollei NIES-4236]